MNGANAINMNLGFMDVTVLAVLGYAVVFFGLGLLLLVVKAMCKAFDARNNG